MDDRQFWILIRRALLLAVAAIEKRWGLAKERYIPLERVRVAAAHMSCDEVCLWR